MNIDFNPAEIQNNTQTNAVGNNGYIPATKWLRVDIQLGDQWIQTGFMNLNGSKPDKSAISLVASLKLDSENPEFIAQQRGIRFTLKEADSAPKELDVSTLL